MSDKDNILNYAKSGDLYNVEKLIGVCHAKMIDASLVIAVDKGNSQLFDLLYPHRTNSFNVDFCVALAAQKGTLSIVKTLLPNTSHDHNYILTQAVEGEQMEVFKYILDEYKHKEGYAKNDHAYDYVMDKILVFNNIDMLDILISKRDMRIHGQKDAQRACLYGNLEIVKKLLPFANPTQNLNKMLRNACNEKHLNLVKFLIPLSNKKDFDNTTYDCAISNNIDCIDLLFEFCDIKRLQELMDTIKHDKSSQQSIDYLKMRCEAEDTKYKLTKDIEINNKHSRVLRKI